MHMGIQVRKRVEIRATSSMEHRKGQQGEAGRGEWISSGETAAGRGGNEARRMGSTQWHRRSRNLCICGPKRYLILFAHTHNGTRWPRRNYLSKRR